jgi:5-formyltetrahydrofolate cyclo-ligase
MPARDDKAALRADALARRDALDPAFREAASRRIAQRVLAMPALAEPVSVFWPIRSEVDTRPLIAALAARGLRLALPVVVRPSLHFRAYAPGEPLAVGRFGLSEPLVGAERLAPKTMLVPLAAFDRAGNRIGYGAGFYDRAIAELAETSTPLTIGLAFATQEVPEVRAEAHDRCLDSVVTEDRVFTCAADRI